MANDRIYIRCGECHPAGLLDDAARALGDQACIIKIWGIEPAPLDCEGPPPRNALTELNRFCDQHKTCGHRGFYLADELGRPLPGLTIPEGENRWHPPALQPEEP